MRTYLLTLLLCCCLLPVPAQSVQWAIDTWGGDPAGFDADFSGEMAIAGWALSPPIYHGLDLSCGSSTTKPFLARYHPDGTLMWARCFAAGNFSVGVKAQMAPASSVYLLGNFYDSISIDGQVRFTSGIRDIFLCKFSQSGQLNWMRQVGGGYGIDMVPNHLGGVTISGSGFFPLQFDSVTVHAPVHDPFTPQDFVAQYDSLGHLRWVATGQTHDLSYQLHADADGSTYLAGSYSQELHWGDDSLQSNNGDAFVLKLDTAGTTQWLHRLTTGGLDQAERLVGRRDGGLYFLLRSDATVPGAAVWYGPEAALQAQIVTDTLEGKTLVHITGDGQWQWRRDFKLSADSLTWEDVRLSLDARDSLHLFALEGTAQGGTFAPIGLRHLLVGRDGSVQASARADDVPVLGAVAIDAWQNTFLYGDFFNHLQLGPFSLFAPTVANTAYLARMGPIVGTREPQSPAVTFSAFPNPSEGPVDIRLTGAANGHWWLADLQGRVLTQGTCVGGQARLSLAPYAPGMYLLHVREGGRAEVLRLVRP